MRLIESTNRLNHSNIKDRLNQYMYSHYLIIVSFSSDMMVLRDTTKYNLHGSDERRLDTNPNYISSTTIASKP